MRHKCNGARATKNNGGVYTITSADGIETIVRWARGATPPSGLVIHQQAKDIYFTDAELRLLRSVIRDYLERGEHNEPH
jgi:hypothetical protein